MNRYRLERVYAGVQVRQVVRLEDDGEWEEFRGLMAQLARTRPRLVEMFRDKQVSARDLLSASRADRLGSLLPDERLLMPLDAAMDAAWKRSRRTGPRTLVRYRTSAAKLRRYVPGLRLVRDLEDAPWDDVAGEWEGSPSDWMHCYRMISRFLTLHLGSGRVGRLHPWRAKVMDLLPRKRERRRVPSISPALFLRLVGQTAVHVQPCYMTLAITGFRTGEYLALTREHLRPHTFEIAVPGTKTAESEAVIPVDPELWPWIDRAVPSPVRYAWLRKHWVRACRAEGLSDVRLHDLRHCTGQWATDAKVPEAMVQAYLRHSDPATTRRYTLQQIRGEVATAMANVLRTGTA